MHCAETGRKEAGGVSSGVRAKEGVAGQKLMRRSHKHVSPPEQVLNIWGAPDAEITGNNDSRRLEEVETSDTHI